MASPQSFSQETDLASFFGDPAWRVVVRRTFAYWQVERRVFGIALWGRPDESDVTQICAAHEIGADPLFRGHASLVDLRGLEAVDVLAFEQLLAYLKQRRDAWSPNVSRQIVLHRTGFAQATILGMFQMLSPAHPVRFVDDPRTAYELAGAADAHDALEALHASLLGQPDALRRTHAAFESLPPRPSFADVARHLGVSVRTLQRQLAELGTSLRTERQKHLVRASERLLEGTALDLEAIAAQVGASSASHLVRLFREHRGVTPGELRKARRLDGGI